MPPKSLYHHILATARRLSGMSQRRLAATARTAQSVVARIESGDTSPTLRTLDRLLAAAGFELRLELLPRLRMEPGLLDDVPRILRLSPENRLREVANLSRFLHSARRA
jgi:transcriptional regulator with XRE-family HTH domain